MVLAAWAGGWLALAAGSVLASGGDFTIIGHAVALMIGMTVGTRFREPSPWTSTRYGLLVAASAFGYLMICFGYLSSAPPPRSVRSVRCWERRCWERLCHSPGGRLRRTPRRWP